MIVTSNPSDLSGVLEQLRQAEPDVLRSMLTAFVQALMSADADAACGAEFGTRTPDRTNRRNGYRSREWDTRAGTIELAIPKLREGSYFPEWLLERRRRAEKALISVVATSYLLGVSTRRMEKLVEPPLRAQPGRAKLVKLHVAQADRLAGTRRKDPTSDVSRPPELPKQSPVGA